MLCHSHFEILGLEIAHKEKNLMRNCCQTNSLNHLSFVASNKGVTSLTLFISSTAGYIKTEKGVSPCDLSNMYSPESNNNISTTLIPIFSAENTIHYTDLILRHLSYSVYIC